MGLNPDWHCVGGNSRRGCAIRDTIDSFDVVFYIGYIETAHLIQFIFLVAIRWIVLDRAQMKRAALQLHVDRLDGQANVLFDQAQHPIALRQAILDSHVVAAGESICAQCESRPVVTRCARCQFLLHELHTDRIAEYRHADEYAHREGNTED